MTKPEPVTVREDLKKEVLLLGCGNLHDKRITFGGDEDGENLIGPGSPYPAFNQYARLHLHDFDEGLRDKFMNQPEYASFTLHDLNELPYPWPDNYFDEIHAYEVLEHCGSQGDGDFFFGQFNEFWRMLKDDGYFMLSVPAWDAEVAWGVPDHRRVMPPGLFGFLSKEYYEQVGEKSGYGDYRHFLDGRYWLPIAKHESEEQFHCVLRKVPKTDD
jgi:SAM-dependent methyltransferase